MRGVMGWRELGAGRWALTLEGFFLALTFFFSSVVGERVVWTDMWEMW